jgi:hypothetical protein
MRVAMVVGLLLFNVLMGLYGNGFADNASADTGLADTPQVQAADDQAPPPPSWP